MEVLEKIKGQIAEFDEKKKQLLEGLRTEFAPMLAPLFEKHPKITSIGWTQYTPYFNDGDECVFGVNLDYSLSINGEDEDEIDSLDWRIPYFLKGDPEYKDLLTQNPKIDLEFYKGIQEFKEILQTIPESFFKDLFGDHVQVTISNDGTNIYWNGTQGILSAHLDNKGDWRQLQILQYTGLKDKNGVEIYEGDIVKAQSHNPSNYLIEFIEGGFCGTNPKIKHYPCDINHFYNSTGCHIEIIGNIYQHPELINR